MDKRTLKQLSLDALNHGNFLRVNKKCIKKIGLINACVLSNFMDNYKYHEKHTSDFDGWFHYSYEWQMSTLNLKKNTLLEAIRTLLKEKLMERKKQGMPAKFYYQLNFESIAKLVYVLESKESSTKEALHPKKVQVSKHPRRTTVTGVETDLKIPTNKKMESPIKEAQIQKKFESQVQRKSESGDTIESQQWRGLKKNYPRATKNRVNKNKVKSKKIIEKKEKVSNYGQTPKEIEELKLKPYIELATRLSGIIQKTINISHDSKRLKQWARDIRKLNTVDNVPYSRIKDALEWYDDNIGGEYIPVIQSGYSLRNKFGKLENAIERESKQTNPNLSKGRMSKRSGLDYSKLVGRTVVGKSLSDLNN